MPDPAAAPASVGMSIGRLTLAGILVAGILAGHFVCMAQMRECWPFSWYPVYSSVAEPDLVVYRMVAISRDTNGSPRESIVLGQKEVPGYTETFMRNSLRRTYGWGTEPEMRRAADVVRDYINQYEQRRREGKHDGPPLERVELRRLTFDSAGDDTQTPKKVEPILSVDVAGQTTLIEPPHAPAKRPPRNWGRPIGVVALVLVLAIFVVALRPGTYLTFWLTPRSPAWLGFSRLLFFALLAAFYLPLDLAIVAHRAAESYLPTGLFYYLHIPAPTYPAMHAIELVWDAALVLSCAGLITRVSTAATFIGGFYLLGMQHQWGKQGHGDAMLLLVMLIFAVARSGDAWSIDALIRRRRGGQPRMLPPSAEYIWPIRAIWITMAIAIAASGVAKFRVSGLDWALSDNLSNVIRQHFVGNYSNPIIPRSLGNWLADRSWLTRPMALGAMFVETLFPIALLDRRLRRVVVPGMLALQIGIALTMGVVFTQFLFVYILWINWPWLGERLRLQR